MKLKTLALSLAVAGATSVSLVPAAAQAGVSANAGIFSDYVWRGVQQNGSDTMAVQGGLDYEADNGLFVGIWGSTVLKGYEYDLYAGWGGEVNGIDLGIAYTSFNYTDSAVGGTNEFEEVSLSAGMGPVSIGADIDVDKDQVDYTHYSISYDASAFAEGVSLTYGVTDTKGTSANAGYLNVNYSTTIDMGVDLMVDYFMNDNNNNSGTNELVIGLSKSFDLM
ncbi:TorF family putative porin [Thiomicrorhabdus sediminis]|uniref:Histidine kinase n=1 Tax=Thiomicrorhabdus sediminis TaxID=2580412 RepID=A0A4P9K7B6_9GAMM|nr:TorF family putative porin [Thiomicrorhabdus sediminis]QCU90791.1 hypothetical protein FE785_09195 [Thiomicrorhabdus sediminis]